MQFDHYAVCTTIIVKVTYDFDNMKIEVPEEIERQQEQEPK